MILPMQKSFRKSGFITRDWYPLFLAVRRGDRSFEEQYLAGHISHDAKRIYEILAGGESLPVHDLKQSAGFGPGGQSAFDRALVELQMGLYHDERPAAENLNPGRVLWLVIYRVLYHRDILGRFRLSRSCSDPS